MNKFFDFALRNLYDIFSALSCDFHGLSVLVLHLLPFRLRQFNCSLPIKLNIRRELLSPSHIADADAKELSSFEVSGVAVSRIGDSLREPWTVWTICSWIGQLLVINRRVESTSHRRLDEMWQFRRVGGVKWALHVVCRWRVKMLEWILTLKQVELLMIEDETTMMWRQWWLHVNDKQVILSAGCCCCCCHGDATMLMMMRLDPLRCCWLRRVAGTDPDFSTERSYGYIVRSLERTSWHHDLIVEIKTLVAVLVRQQ